MFVFRAHNLCINNYTTEEQQVASKSRTNVYNYKVSRKKHFRVLIVGIGTFSGTPAT